MRDVLIEYIYLNVKRIHAKERKRKRKEGSKNSDMTFIGQENKVSSFFNIFFFFFVEVFLLVSE